MATSNFEFGSGNPLYVAPTPVKTIAQLQADVAAQKQAVKDAAAKAAAANAAADAAAAKAAAAEAKNAPPVVPGLVPAGSKAIFQMLGGKLYFNGTLFTGKSGTTDYVNGIAQGGAGKPDAPPPPPTTVPGSTGFSTTSTRTLAADTFANTLAIIFGAQEASQPYVAKLYSLVSNYYKTGSTIDEALNLAIREARTTNAIPEFTKRFAGIFALDDLL
jgi:hypothetical protein